MRPTLHPHPRVTALAKKTASAAPRNLFRFAGEVIRKSFLHITVS
jgi:hypothetical protein